MSKKTVAMVAGGLVVGIALLAGAYTKGAYDGRTAEQATQKASADTAALNCTARLALQATQMQQGCDIQLMAKELAR